MDADRDYWFDPEFHAVVYRTIRRELQQQEAIRQALQNEEWERITGRTGGWLQ